MLAAALGVTACPVALAEEAPVQPELVARVKNIIEVDGCQFKDLNDNGALDPYEDWRLTPEERAEDLLSQMDATQKAFQMVHLTLVSKKDSWFNENNVGFALVYEYIFDSATEAAKRTNEIQELSESAPLGIPVIFSMDTEAGAAFVKDATFLPDEINQGAVNDPELVTRLNQVLKEELMAVGVRMALSPDADLITDPRWGRNQECYSEDTDVVQSLIVAAVMPYGYSTVPYLGGDAVENSADQSAAVMTDLLRGELGYTGLIQTDWGLNFVGATNAGADILGGAGVRSTRQLVEDVDEERLTDACRRILIAKFQLGIFENPYVDEENAAQVLGSEEHRAVAKEAAARSFTLLKYENASPLAGQKLVVAGTLAEDVRALNSGWTAKDPVELAGTTILEAFQNKGRQRKRHLYPRCLPGARGSERHHGGGGHRRSQRHP